MLINLHDFVLLVHEPKKPTKKEHDDLWLLETVPELPVGDTREFSMFWRADDCVAGARHAAECLHEEGKHNVAALAHHWAEELRRGQRRLTLARRGWFVVK
jgi:hypothetical protein